MVGSLRAVDGRSGQSLIEFREVYWGKLGRVELTDIDKPARRSLAELFALVGQRDLDHAGYVPRRGLDPYRVRCYQL